MLKCDVVIKPPVNRQARFREGTAEILVVPFESGPIANMLQSSVEFHAFEQNERTATTMALHT